MCQPGRADYARRNEITKMWHHNWNWNQSLSTPKGSQSAPPWQAVRLIGHRGSGKTSRPVIK